MNKSCGAPPRRRPYPHGAFLGGILLVLMGCTRPAPEATGTADANDLHGTLTYRERVALPPDATARVALVEASGSASAVRVVAAQTLAPSGRQVPLPFTLPVNTAALDTARLYELRAHIAEADGAVRWRTLGAIPIDPLSRDATEVLLYAVGSSPPPAAVPQTFVYACEDLRIVAQVERERTRLFLPDRAVMLPQVRAASGARYSNGPVTFWSKEDEALVEIGQDTYRACARRPEEAPWAAARLRGVHVRAVGNEPGWSLEITDGDLLFFETDYGARRYAFETPSPETEAGATTYRVAGAAHELTAVLEEAPCRDSMSGAPFETTATVTFDGATYRGCARSLR